jgi:type VI secretion system secreted protein VgrG
MVLPTQAYSLKIGGQPATLCSVLSFRGREHLSKPFRLEIEFTSAKAGIAMADVLGKPAKFMIQTIDPEAGQLLRIMGEELAGKLAAKMPSRHFHGIVTQFDELGRSADETRYLIVIEPRIADLGRAVTSRLFQHQSVPETIESVLRHFGMIRGTDFDFMLRAEYPQREYTTQYEESSVAFIQRLMAEEGLHWRIRHDRFQDVLVIGDDIDAYARNQLSAPLRADAGLESVGAEAIKTLIRRRRRVVQAVQLNDYNHRTASTPLLTQENAARGDTTTGAVEYLWGEHYPTPEEGRRIARLRHEAHLAGQLVFEGTGNVLGLAAGEVLRFPERLPDAKYGLVVVSVEHAAARGEAYTNRFTAIPSDRVYRTPVDPGARPKISGILPARIMSPDRYDRAHLTAEGFYRVKAPFDLDQWSPGGTSRPVRLAKPYAGRDYGHHFPLIDGTEVALAFTGGDPDRPVIVGALHDSQHPDLVTSRNNTRNLMRTAARNELCMEDRHKEEHVHLSTPYQASVLNLGHMEDGQRKQRGAGAELCTDGHLALRAAKGVLISAQGQASPNEPQLGMAEAKAQLDAALAQMESLADSARKALAHAAEIDKQRQFLEQRLDKLQQAVMLASAPAGVALTSGHHMQLAARRNLMVSARGSADIGVLKKFTVAAGGAISLFARKLGIKLFAAAGKVEIQAQSDEMNLTALKDLKIISVDGKLILSAEKEVWIGAGGSYTRYTAAGIENGTAGDIREKCATWDKPGQANETYPTPSLPHGELLGKDTLRFAPLGADHLANDVGWIGKPYRITGSNGNVLHEGEVRKGSRMPRTVLSALETLTLTVGNGAWMSSDVVPDANTQADSSMGRDALPTDDDLFGEAVTDSLSDADGHEAPGDDLFSKGILAQVLRGEE